MGFLSNILRRITATKLEGKNRKDSDFQNTFQTAIEKGKIVKVGDVKSSRWQKRGNDTYYGPLEDIDYENSIERSVDSSAIDSIEYDPKTEDLKVRFRGGSVWYTYPNVPADVVTEFMDAPSKGRYLAYVIKPQYSVGDYNG